MGRVTFVVEQAGCPSCASRVRAALEPLGTLEGIEIDEAADSAAVQLEAEGAIGEDDVERALEGASLGQGHVYRVKPGSWAPLL